MTEHDCLHSNRLGRVWCGFESVNGLSQKKEGENMQLHERLNEQTKQKLNELKKQNKHKTEQYSKREILELMGVNRPTYKRVRGAIRRK